MKHADTKVIRLSEYRPPNFFIDHTELEFDLDAKQTRVSATLHLRKNKDEPGATLVLHGSAEMKLESVLLDGEVLSSDRYTRGEETLTISDVPDACKLGLVTEVNPEENKALEGLYLSGGNYCTQCEAEGFRRITFYLDRPDVMATFRTKVIGDKKSCPVLLSNGNPVESGELEDGRHFVVWDDPFKKPSYLFALVAGDLVRREDTFKTMSGRNVDLHVYVRAPDLDQTEHCMESLKRSFTWDEERFGREYDLDLFQIVAVSDFNMGAMENKGLNVFNTKYVLARPDTATDTDYAGVEGVVGHEYFHNWSGNRVTCRDWFQLSLKEGFTVFRDQEFSSDVGSRAVKRIEDVSMLRAYQFPEDAGPTAHPVRPEEYEEISNFYTRTVYEKGAEVVRMIHTLLGAADFRKGTDLYFERHDGQAVTCEDFAKAMEDASGKDLTQFRRWYSQAGTPKVSVEEFYDESKKEYRIKLIQEVPDTRGQKNKEPMVIPCRAALLDASGNIGEEKILMLTEETQEFVFENQASQPVPSLFRGFSAPIKLMHEETPKAIQFRAAHDDDPYCRWEAAQSLARGVLLDKLPAETLDPVFESSLANMDADPALIALALALPGESELYEYMDVVDPDAIFTRRESLRKKLGTKFSALFTSRYEALSQTGPYRTAPESMGQRSLRNLSLSYLFAGNSDSTLAKEQFRAASNMTDTLAALRVLTEAEDDARNEALKSFYARFKDHALVIDKWFSIQAMSKRDDVLDRVHGLLKHADFDIKNPNRARSLIGVFAMANPHAFHRADGAGYRFLADHVVQLDAFNGQIAARMLPPLLRWRRFDDARQALMRSELERIVARDSVSKDVAEQVHKSLN